MRNTKTFRGCVNKIELFADIQDRVKDIESGTEITCNYKYKLQKAPEWYKRCLKTFLSVNLHCSEQDQQLLEKKLLHNNETILT